LRATVAAVPGSPATDSMKTPSAAKPVMAKPIAM
jgi:hypothetical protein